MNSVRGSLFLSAANSYIGLALQIASTVIVARILTPAEVGVFAVAAVFAALASTFRDFGVAEYLIQKKEVTEADLRASFTVNLAASWLIGAVLFAAAPLLSHYYTEPGIGDVMRVQALNFVLIPFGAVTLAWFRREMQFKPIFLAGIAANAVSFVVAVGLALAGFSYMSLAWSGFAGVAVTVLVAFVQRPKWFPRRPGWKGVREVFSFGKFASGVFVAGQLGKGAPEMVLGRTDGMAEVGMFSRASGLVEMFNRLVVQAAAPVCLPYLASGARRDGTVVPALRQATTMLTGLGWPFLFFLAVAAFPAIRLMYGAQWVDAVVLAQVLCLVAAVELLFRFANQALFSLGLAKQASKLQLVVQGLRIAGVFAAVPFGSIGAAWGLAVAAVLGAAFTQWMLARHAAYRWRDTTTASWPSLRLSVLSVGPYFLWACWSPPNESNYVWSGIGGGLATLLLWVAALRHSRHPLWGEVVRAFTLLRQKLT